MKARIADEIARTDMTSAIAREITSAISFYQSTRFWWNEKRSITFPTVAAQEFYTSSDQANIPNLLDIDYITVTQSSRVFGLEIQDPLTLEAWSTASSAAGVPHSYAYYEQRLRLYPIPNDVYTIRLAGVFRVAEPASDGEASNPWMVDGEELVRARAKSMLYLHNLMDTQSASIMKQAESEALQRLRAETSRRMNVTRIKSSESVC